MYYTSGWFQDNKEINEGATFLHRFLTRSPLSKKSKYLSITLTAQNVTVGFMWLNLGSVLSIIISAYFESYGL